MTHVDLLVKRFIIWRNDEKGTLYIKTFIHIPIKSGFQLRRYVRLFTFYDNVFVTRSVQKRPISS